MASLLCAVCPSPSVIGFRRPNRKPSTTVLAIGANLSPTPLNLRIKNAARLPVRQSSFALFASNANPPDQDALRGKSDGTATSNSRQDSHSLKISVTMAMASLLSSICPSPSVLGFRRPNRKPSITVLSIAANLSSSPLNLRLKNAARLQVRQSSFAVFASNTNPPDQDRHNLEEEEKTYLDRLDLEEEEKALGKEEKSSSEEKEKTDQYRPDDLTYQERLDSHQSEVGLPDAIQTGIGELNGLPVALGVLDFRFIAGTMGSVVGEKITRLTEYATREFLPLIIVCASGGARIQEGSLSLMQMGKISCALYNYQLDARRFYISILTSPTTGGVTASFGMLGKIVIAEPEATIAFAGKRVIEETLNIEVPEGVQQTEYLFTQGAFDLILPRFYLKRILYLIYKLNQYTLDFA